jgi:DNA-directed RNA polymerase specialized sigma24 family protein
MTTLLLVGAVGARVALAERWHAAPLAELRADVDLQALKAAHGALDFTQRALCVAANEAIEGGVAATSAPECSTILAGGSGTSQGAPPAGREGGEESCFDELQPLTAQVRAQLEAARVPRATAEDAASEALVVTCTKTPPPRSLRNYFFKVARNYGRREQRAARRYVDCQAMERFKDEDFAGRCVASGSYEEGDEEQDAEAAAALWHTVRCNVGETTEQIIKARLAGQRFRAIGAQLGLSEAVARSKFHNAMTKLRTRREICNSPLRAGR